MVDSSSIELPVHIAACATKLAETHCEANPITAHEFRPLIASSAIWLARQGVANRQDHPGVIDAMGKLLTDVININVMSRGSRGNPVALADKIKTWLEDNIRRGDFLLQVSKSETLNTPLRALDTRGKLQVMSGLPAQGHSGKSILGMGRIQSPSLQARGSQAFADMTTVCC